MLLRTLLLLLACAVTGCAALDNGLSARPLLGFSTWHAFGGSVSEENVKQTADLMVSLGLRDLGFVYLNMGDGWAAAERVDGKLVPNPTRFPSGIPPLADYVHSKGLKLGIYSDAGHRMCLGEAPGSLGHEEVDAQTFADWGLDGLTYGNCGASTEEWVIDRYTAMRDALNKTRIPFHYAIANWGDMEPWLWAQPIGNSWRTAEDIAATWDGVVWDSIIKTVDYTVGTSQFAGADKGGFPDLDLLNVGDPALFKFPQEQRTQFALWALFKSPLIISTDLSSINDTSLAVLKSKEVIAVNQDPLGVPGDLIWQQGTKRIFAGPLAGGARAVVLASFQTTQSQYPRQNITVFWEQLGLQRGQRCSVRDLFSEEDLGTFVGSFSASVAVHDVMAVRITPMEGRRDDSWRPWHQQPMYAAQPANTAVPNKQQWVAMQALRQAYGTQWVGAAHRALANAYSQLPSTVVGFVAVAFIGIVGHYALKQLRRHGGRKLMSAPEDGMARKLSSSAVSQGHSTSANWHVSTHPV